MSVTWAFFLDRPRRHPRVRRHGVSVIELRLFGALELQGGDGAARDAILRQPKRLGLLAFLSIEGARGFVRRDRLVALLWPEHTESSARHALRQSLHVIRRALGPDVFVVRGDEEISVNDAVLRCDAVRFEQLLDAGDRAAALELYHGHLLPAFFVAGASEFDRWLEDTRARLVERAAAGAISLERDACAGGDLQRAIAWARKACELGPNDESTLRRLIEYLERAGDRAGALKTYELFARRLGQDMDAEPSAATQAVVKRIRERILPRRVSESLSMPGSPTERVSDQVAALVAPIRRRPVLAIATTSLTVALALFIVPSGVRSPSSLPAAVVQAGGPAPLRSAVVQRLYDEGLRAWMRGDRRGAEQLMRAAATEDSTFALAVFTYGHLLGLRGEHARAYRLQTRAVQLAPTQNDQDRLFLVTWFASIQSDPRFPAYAESLAVRYPDNLEGQLFVAQARAFAGDFLGVIAPLRRVVAGDTLSQRYEARKRCLACEAYGGLITAYENADSLDASMRVAREWTRVLPQHEAAWGRLSYELQRVGRHAEALAARQKADDLRPDGADVIARAEILMRAGDFETMYYILAPLMASGSFLEREEARFPLWQGLRAQGRMREALTVAHHVDTASHREPALRGIATIMRAQSLFDNRRFAEAAFVWDSAATEALKNNSPSAAARNRIWNLLHRADALAGAGDANGLLRLADSLRADGMRSGYGRDRRLYHHALGLREAVLGRNDRACDEFKAALFGQTAYIRTNLGLGEACLAADRRAESIHALRAVLRGPVGNSGTYGTHTEARALLARAFELSGMRDSALAHYRRVADAWSKGDPAFSARSEDARRRISALGAGRVSVIPGTPSTLTGPGAGRGPRGR